MPFKAQTGHARTGTFLFAGSVIMLSVMICGCTSTAKPGKPLAAELAGSDPDAQVNFWHSLVDQPVTTNDEAFHGLLLYVDGKDDSADYVARVNTLKARKMLPAGWDEPATDAVRRGTVAVALMRVLNERGGVTTTLLEGLTGGPTSRYATRELMFLNVYPSSTPNQSFSGNEFVGVIGRVEDFQRGNPENVSAQVLPGEMNPSPTPSPSTQPVRKQ
jgi:hypothetical protein